jgi:hypothetical protein
VDYLEIKRWNTLILWISSSLLSKVQAIGRAEKVLDPQLLESDRFSRFKSKFEYVRDVIPKEMIDNIGKEVWAIEAESGLCPSSIYERPYLQYDKRVCNPERWRQFITRRVIPTKSLAKSHTSQSTLLH